METIPDRDRMTAHYIAYVLVAHFAINVKTGEFEKLKEEEKIAPDPILRPAALKATQQAAQQAAQAHAQGIILNFIFRSIHSGCSPHIEKEHISQGSFSAVPMLMFASKY